MRRLDYTDFLNIENISENTNFWLVRTNGGRFYEEYKSDGYIALGWNLVDSKNVYEDDEVELKLIKDELERVYEKKKGGTIFNKCLRFVDEMQPGDIVMVPNSENEEIFFARVGDYYEEDIDYTKEVEILKRIKDKEDFGIELRCPYKKRREIEILKCVKGNRLNPNLFRALASSHGISNINKYSDFILSSIYNLYVKENKLNMVINIEQTEGINGKDFSKLIYNICDITTLVDDKARVTTQANVNSPGDLVHIIDVANNIYDYIKNNWIAVLFIYGIISGIKIGPIEMKSIIEVINKGKKDKSEIENNNIVNAGLKIDNESKRLDNEMKKIELERKTAEWTEEKIRKAREIAEEIKNSANNLRVDQEAASRVINFRTNDE